MTMLSISSRQIEIRDKNGRGTVDKNGGVDHEVCISFDSVRLKPTQAEDYTVIE